MPIEKRSGETRDEFVSRCVKTEMDAGKPQDQALAICLTYADENFATATQSVTDNTWSTEAPINVNFAKVSFDYDETLSTPKGMEMAKNAIERGDEVYIISARREKIGMETRARELGIPLSRVIATGSNKAKVEKIKELKIDKHIDNNRDVIKMIPGVGEKFGKVKRVLFNEDFNEEEIKEWKDLGYKVSILSKRKIKRQDKKVWNRLKSVGLSEQDLVFGSIEEVDKRWNFDVLLTGQDPLLEKFMTMGEDFNPKKVLSSQVVESMEEAEKTQEMLLKSVEMRFVTVKVVYTYEEIPGIPAAQSGSRPFCTKMMSSNKQYSLDEIRQLSNKHLIELGYGSKYAGLQPDVFQWRGGFYRKPGTLETTPWCRHQWKVNVVMG
jgi:3-deoxy-D-manno-octulosonate 8-phosphate phosphatase KdsC-like HAD superfamily phosphatase